MAIDPVERVLAQVQDTETGRRGYLLPEGLCIASQFGLTSHAPHELARSLQLFGRSFTD